MPFFLQVSYYFEGCDVFRSAPHWIGGLPILKRLLRGALLAGFFHSLSTEGQYIYAIDL